METAFAQAWVNRLNAAVEGHEHNLKCLNNGCVRGPPSRTSSSAHPAWSPGLPPPSARDPCRPPLMNDARRSDAPDTCWRSGVGWSSGSS